MGRSYQIYHLNVIVEAKWLKHQRSWLSSECRWKLSTLGKTWLNRVRLLGYSLICRIHGEIKAFIGALNFFRAEPGSENNVLHITPWVIAHGAGIWFLSRLSLGYINSHPFCGWGILCHLIAEGRVWTMKSSKAHWLSASFAYEHHF